MPQLVNILFGQMSFVGQRPDVSGYYDYLQGEDRKLLELKPGLCSMAALKYYNEETILAAQNDPLHFNNTIIFPDKIMMNMQYYNKRSTAEDFRIMKACTLKIFSKKFSI